MTDFDRTLLEAHGKVVKEIMDTMAEPEIIKCQDCGMPNEPTAGNCVYCNNDPVRARYEDR